MEKDASTSTVGPIYQRLAEEFAARIAAGELAPGAALPTVRELARERGVDRNTVVRAYALLAAQGLVTSAGRRGTHVRAAAVPPRRQLAPNLGESLRYQGSHDFCLDVLAQRLGAIGVQMELHVTGSAAGLRALAAGLAELAGAHLLDDDGAGYNSSAVRRALPGRDVRLVTLVEREQGLIVPRGNPRGLRVVEDLAQSGLRIVNRQPGSGTRRLLDALLTRAGVRPVDLAGYDREVNTHLAAAAAVVAGSADVALGVAAAARALDLEFVPLASERFDLVLLAESLAAPWFGPLIELLAAPAFRAEVEALGGYSAAHSAWIRRVESAAPVAP